MSFFFGLFYFFIHRYLAKYKYFEIFTILLKIDDNYLSCYTLSEKIWRIKRTRLAYIVDSAAT